MTTLSNLQTNPALPTPSVEAAEHSATLVALIQTEIQSAGGWMSFAQFMQLALYAPHLGYYSAGAQKFGESGDFITAPELGHKGSPALFTQTLANQAMQVLAHVSGDILELGAGTGRLALDLLTCLAEHQALPAHYYILEVSADLRETQRQTLQQGLSKDVFARVVWLEQLPNHFTGLILGNEVLDALPVHLIQTTADGLYEMGVTLHEQQFAWGKQALTSGKLFDSATALQLPADYLTELCPAAEALIASLADCLVQGVILMVDYGFSSAEYYHPQRRQGTLMCHYRHYAHDDPFQYIGLQDITAHVNFTQLALTAIAHGLDVNGFCTQAQFLINCGITQVLAHTSAEDVFHYAPLAAQAQKLLSPAEMGDLFKAIAFSKQFDAPLIGFVQGDKRHTL